MLPEAFAARKAEKRFALTCMIFVSILLVTQFLCYGSSPQVVVPQIDNSDRMKPVFKEWKAYYLNLSHTGCLFRRTRSNKQGRFKNCQVSYYTKDGNFVSIWKDMESSKTVYAAGYNSEYAFRVSRESLDEKLKLDKLVTKKESPKFQQDAGRATTVGAQTYFGTHGFVYFPNIGDIRIFENLGPGFVVRNFVDKDDVILVDFEIDYEKIPAGRDLPGGHLLDGSFVLSRKFSFLPLQASYRFKQSSVADDAIEKMLIRINKTRPEEQLTKAQLLKDIEFGYLDLTWDYSLRNGVPHVTKLDVTEADDRPSAWHPGTLVIDSWLTEPPLEHEVFTISNFGFTEPEGVRWKRPDWVWFIVALGFCFLVISAVIRKGNARHCVRAS